MRSITTILCAALLAVQAQADVLHMADGTVRQGRIVSADEKEVVVDFGVGSMSIVTRIPREQIARIEKKASPQETLMSGYVARRARAERGGADGWVALGVWCQQQRVLKTKALEAFRQAVLLDPNHKRARAALGYVKLDDRWMTPQQAMAVLAPGFGDVSEFKARQVAAARDAEVARAEALEAQAKLKKLEAQVDELETQNREMRRRLAVPPPPPPPPRVIYRPFIIYKDRPHGHKESGKKDKDGEPKSK